MPTLRIDADVYRWLQSQARPFEDTPNTVLRRIAGIDQARIVNRHSEARSARKDETKKRRVTGKKLNLQHRLGAKHALYHKEGTFYERLTEFPGVLCDTKGFVRYDSEHQFQNDRELSIGDKVNVRRSLALHPRYQKFAGM
jgi:hypothetical protein